MVTDGLVTEIHGHDDHDSALAAISRLTVPIAGSETWGL